ncbi:hypothetical protein GCM10027093_17560 [Paraburkholderia jirisanensis]|jgi:hypothetical protein
MMHHPVATTSARPSPRVFRSTDATSQAPASMVTIDVTVPGTSSAAGRRALHRALGEDLRLYVMTIDKRHERISFRVEVMSRTVDDVIGALTGSLDQATVGRVRATTIKRLQNA